MSAARRCLAALALLFAITITANAGPIYNLAADFSKSNNPNGVWSYGSKTTLGGSLTVYTQTLSVKDGGGGGGVVDVWYGPGLDSMGGPFPNVFHNGSALQFDSTDPGPGLAPGQLALHAGIDRVSVARFTTPAAGEYAVDVTFYGVTSDTTDVFVLVNGASVYSSPHAGFGAGNQDTYSASLALSAGDTVEFVLGNGGNNYFVDWVGVDATLTFLPAAVPEPASVGLLAAGAAGLLGYARRRRAGRA